MPMPSVGALNDVLIGQRQNWPQTAQRLTRLRMRKDRDAQALAREFWERVRGGGLVSAGFVGVVCSV